MDRPSPVNGLWPLHKETLRAYAHHLRMPPPNNETIARAINASEISSDVQTRRGAGRARDTHFFVLGCANDTHF